MKTRTSLLLFFLFLTSILSAQTKITGRVTDSLKQSIPFASVYISNSNQDILSFSTTNANGNFELTITELGTFYLHINSLSYKEKIQLIEVKDSAFAEKKLSFVMQFESKQIKSVNVNAQKDIVEKPDTIVFRAESFLNGSESVVGDLLKKLPGVEVSETGNVKVNGKNVKKLMVEGDDLFDQNYQILVKNLKVDAIDKVEIINDFSENTLLKDVDNSEDIAMNLKIKEGKKNTLFGDVDFGTDFQESYSAKTNLVAFYKKLKFYSLSSMNNVGDDPVDAIYMLLNPNLFAGGSRVGDGQASATFTHVAQISIPNFNLSRYNFNQAKFSSLNAIYNPNKKLKIKLLAYYFSDKNKLSQKEQKIYFPAGDSFEVQEDFSSDKETQTIYTQLDANYPLNANSKLDYTIKWQTNSLTTQANSFFNSSALSENLTEEKHYLDQTLLYTLKLRQKEAMTFTARYISDNRPQNYTLNPALNQGLFGLSQNYEQINQTSENPIHFAAAEWVYVKNFKNLNIKYTNTYTRKEESLLSSIWLNTEDLETELSDEYANNSELIFSDLSSKLSLQTRLLKMRIHLSSNFHYSMNEFDKSKHSDFYVEPKISISKALSEKQSLLTSYSLNSDYSSLSQLYPNYLMTNFNSFSRQATELNRIKSDIFLLSYNYGSWADKFLVNCMFFYTKKHENYANKYLIAPEYSFSESILLGSRPSINFSAGVDRYFAKLSANLKLHYSLSYFEYSNVSNDLTQNISNLSSNYGFFIRTVFAGFINFNLGSDLIENKINFNQNQGTAKLYDNISFLNTDLKFGKKVFLSLSNKVYIFDLENSAKAYCFSDLQAKYNVKKDKLSLVFSVNNLLNVKEYKRTFISDIYTSIKQNYLIPRMLFVSANYKF